MQKSNGIFTYLVLKAAVSCIAMFQYDDYQDDMYKIRNVKLLL
jgi:hypothetical protein